MDKSVLKNYLSKIVSITFTVVMLIICFFPGILSFLFYEEIEIEDNSSEYIIENYYVDVNVREDNSFQITETITANFLVPSNGIYRILPKISNVKFSQNEKNYNMNYRMKYSAISSSLLYSTDSNSSNFVYVKLGKFGADYIGEKDFTLSYIVNLGEDRLLNFDQFYYNLIGNYWDTQIKNTKIDITFPKTVENQMYLYMGEYGSDDGTVISAVNSNKTKFTYTLNQTLMPGEGLTARVTLPQNYFTTQRNVLFDVILLVTILILLLIIALSYKKTNNKSVLVSVVTFETPKGVNSAEVGYFIDGFVDNSDIASLIVYWASKGYLKIREEKKEIFLSKIKDADIAMKPYEQKLFNEIFDKAYIHSGQSVSEVDVKTLGEKIYLQVSSTKKEIEKQNKSTIFKDSALSSRTLIAFLSALILGMVTFKVNYQIVSTLKILIGMGVALIWFFALLALITIKDKVGTYNNKKKKTKITMFAIVSILILIGYSFVTYNFYADPFLLTFIADLVAIISVVLIYNLNVRTTQGMKIQGELVGLREFIEVAEKDRLEMLIKDDPQSFFSILPYAYVLGVSDVWIKKFENISIEIPNWYVSDSDFLTSYIIIRTIDDNLRKLNAQIIARSMSNPNSSSGGFSSGGSVGGGGFSGGGFGGGGGGRW